MTSFRSRRISQVLHRNSLLFLIVLLCLSGFASAQSILGSITGTVQDSTGAAVPGAVVLLHRTETNSDRTAKSDGSGNYTAINVEPGTYDVTTTAAGFSNTLAKGVVLLARQQLRLDVALSVTADRQTVTVNASDTGTIQTETAQISAALSPRDVLDLPANYRGAGSTSPINVVQTLPGVQPDTAAYPPAPSTHPSPSVRFSIQGGLPSQTETTVDGISAQNQTNNNIQGKTPSRPRNRSPRSASTASIITPSTGSPVRSRAITKSGTNKLHGSVYEYLQNQFLDATPYGTDRANKPHKVANDFGASFGGPVVLPHLYHGQNIELSSSARTRAYATRSPMCCRLRVPTARDEAGGLLTGDVHATPSIPFTGGTYANNVVPINRKFGGVSAVLPRSLRRSTLASRCRPRDRNRGYNYLSTRRDDISSNQFDVRGDQNFGQRATVFARYTFKNDNQLQPADLALPYSIAFAQYRIFASSFTYAFTPHLANEFRFGFTLERDGNANPFDGTAFNTSTGLAGPHAEVLQRNTAPPVQCSFQSVGSRLGFEERSRLFQFVDNVTLQRGAHTLRFGLDIRHLSAYTEAGGGYDNFSLQFHRGTVGYGHFAGTTDAAGNTIVDPGPTRPGVRRFSARRPLPITFTNSD